ncbi:hypothetical protein Q0590_09935 [Rhodocytophaga aerolata]|uniref:Probable sensor domain-containing protein n=1 Tax=Rhodocytophaga aerolata TaxID=455078 RepID=A0ABT8R389_9BACT|nr:hypothetical protein [Rhodocytophaga aerolata]MDO1446570.1 hypothetical protein [Rhodocytophaga aerolata]
MSRQSPYHAAREVAITVEKHFAHYLAMARLNKEKDLAPAPHAREIEAIINTAFWTSLGHEEGIYPKISMAFLPMEGAKDAVRFSEAILFSPGNLTKLAPGVERPGTHLGIWQEAGELYVWGICYDVPSLCLVVDVFQPGLLVLKYRRINGVGKFANIAVVQGDQVKIVDMNSTSFTDCPDLLTSLIDFTTFSQSRSLNILVQLAVSMREHGRGGILLIVPAGTQTWTDSVVHPLKYTIQPPFGGLSRLMQEKVTETKELYWKNAVAREIGIITGFTAVDGATLINDQYELLTFGAKIRRAGKDMVKQMMVSEPVVGNKITTVHPSTHGGTRHLAAAQFAYDRQDSMALVASQDGRFTVFVWSPSRQMVHAHRVDSLLL